MVEQQAAKGNVTGHRDMQPRVDLVARDAIGSSLVFMRCGMGEMWVRKNCHDPYLAIDKMMIAFT